MATTPEERVTAFLTDYTRRHAAAAGTFDPPNPEAWENWRRACREVSREHGTDKFLVSSDSYQGASPFDPATTRFTEVAVRGQYATVSAVREAAYRFVEFKLRRIDDDWRMNDVKEYLKDPDRVHPAVLSKGPSPGPRRRLPRRSPQRIARILETCLSPASRFVRSVSSSTAKCCVFRTSST
ncbi:hypothetical protein M3G03_11880 [Aestuariimicrobium sp. p3-SID1156]|uniref:hypothetical protein n=1 Tax=Aestuariimicrobium sp. p3-SID1156 TaxID=2916038 RepID=UPI00223BB40E|nr:hypothetical protein [Aestuariimicrobium sp. p3-SID1156]MCT1460229.1 hypothetical protein [Aestuariimicrobium sp. p3-SID1156]